MRRFGRIWLIFIVLFELIAVAEFMTWRGVTQHWFFFSFIPVSAIALGIAWYIDSKMQNW